MKKGRKEDLKLNSKNIENRLTKSARASSQVALRGTLMDGKKN